MSLRIAIEGFPFKATHSGGPRVFTRRLTEYIVSQKLAKVRRISFSLCDISINLSKSF